MRQVHVGCAAHWIGRARVPWPSVQWLCPQDDWAGWRPSRATVWAGCTARIGCQYAPQSRPSTALVVYMHARIQCPDPHTLRHRRPTHLHLHAGQRVVGARRVQCCSQRQHGLVAGPGGVRGRHGAVGGGWGRQRAAGGGCVTSRQHSSRPCPWHDREAFAAFQPLNRAPRLPARVPLAPRQRP